MPRINTEADFWASVTKTDGCWLWTRRDGYDGYGCFSLQRKLRYAHHWSYIFTNKLELNKKLYLCHTCDNRKCVNPAHLYEGNNTTNARDMMARGRGKGQFTKDTPTVFKKGHITASRKISADLAFNIKKDLLDLRQCDVIRKYDVSRDTVRAIARGDSWASLEVVS